MNYQKCSIENKQGQKLGARLDLPLDGKPLAYALFAHCFTCSKNLKAVGNISRALTQEGIAVLRFDFAGLGESEGDFADTNFSSNIDDLVATADYLVQHFEGPKLLIGHSLGGAAVLQAATRIPSVMAVATIGAPCEAAHVLKNISEARDDIETNGKATVTLAGRPFTIKKQFLDDLNATHMKDTIAHLGKPLLIFHSPIDNTVGIQNAADIFLSAKHPKSFVSLDRADHLLTNERDSLYVGATLEAWARKYLGLDIVRKEESRTIPSDGTQVIIKIERQKYRSEILAAGHGLIADEPVSVGGQNLGPNPYDLLLSSLGACTAMTLRMYADRKDLPLEQVIVRLNHAKIHAQDCKGCETPAGRIDQIDREIELVGPLDEAQRKRLLEIADRCPVHKTLHAEVSITSRLRE